MADYTNKYITLKNFILTAIDPLIVALIVMMSIILRFVMM